ncbi:MAG: hypothetical protein JNM76_03615 [Betaproteobacteria bacterium]|nr:hypothetical protein [Betaproteobacteria bacterium]
MNKRVSVLLKLDPDLSDALRRASGVTGQSVDDLVAEAVREWLKAHPDQAGLFASERALQDSLAEYNALYRRLSK